MKGSKKDKGKKKVVETESRYADDSDDEAPEIVSNSAMKNEMKTDLEALQKQLESFKQELRQAEKTKRRNRQEMYIEQKKAKMSSINYGGLNDEGNSTEETDNIDATTEGNADQIPKQNNRLKRKVYSSFNVVVEPLTKSDNCRASAALDFKSRRLAKIPRESIQTSVISYNKKLQARK